MMPVIYRVCFCVNQALPLHTSPIMPARSWAVIDTTFNLWGMTRPGFMSQIEIGLPLYQYIDLSQHVSKSRCLVVAKVVEPEVPSCGLVPHFITFLFSYNKSVIDGSQLNELTSIGNAKGIMALSNIILDTLPNVSIHCTKTMDNRYLMLAFHT